MIDEVGAQLLAGCPYKDDPEFHQMLKEEMEKHIMAAAARADRELQEAAKVNYRTGVRALPNGQIKIMMPNWAYVHYKVNERADFSSREDRKILERLHPAMAVRSGRNKLGVGWQPAGVSTAPVSGNVKFRKVYCNAGNAGKTSEPS